MTTKVIRRAQLIKGGDIIKQGETFTLGFRLFDANDRIIQLESADVVTVKIANRTGIIKEVTASKVDDYIEFTVNESIGHGEMRVELTVTNGSNVQKYPAREWIRLLITQSLDDAGAGGIQAITAQQMFSRIEVAETKATSAETKAVSAETTATNVQRDFDLILAEAGDSNPEIVAARLGEDNLRVFNEKTIAQLADIGTNVKSFGAVGDGVTDDSAAVQNAIDFCAANGTALYFPKGIYLTRSLINMRDRTRIKGESPQLSIIKNTADNLDGRALSFRGLGTAQNKLRDLSIENIAFDTSDGSRVGVEHVQNFTMRNTRFFGQAGLRLDLVDEFNITDTEMYDCEYGISLMTCTKGNIKNTFSQRVPEVIDFFNCDRVVVDGIVASDYTGLNLDEVIDIGASRNITIQNIIGEGFNNGIKIKTEGNIALAPNNITIANCTFLQMLKHGVDIEIKGGVQRPPNKQGDITISNVTIESTVVGSRGIAINRKDADAQPFDTISIENVNIKVDSYGISTQTNEPTRPLEGKLKIKNTKVISTGSVAYYLVNAADVTIGDGSSIQSLMNTAILAVTTKRVSITNTTVLDSVQGIRTTNCYDWTIDNCTINGVNGHGIQFDVTQVIDSFNPILTVSNTKIYNFGKVENFKSAIAFTSSIPAGTPAPFSGFRLQGNRLAGAAGSNTHYGYGFATNGENFKNVIIKDNNSENLNSFMINAVLNKIDVDKRVISDNLTTLKGA